MQGSGIIFHCKIILTLITRELPKRYATCTSPGVYKCLMQCKTFANIGPVVEIFVADYQMP